MLVKRKNIQGIGMTSQRARERLIVTLKRKGIQNLDVLNAIGQAPRHLFVDEALAHKAYNDIALPISHGQTISQPYIVARMTEALLEFGPLANVLEIGTGSGYQTYILSLLIPKVYTVERVSSLEIKARSLVSQLKRFNIQFRHGDGTQGWAHPKTFDAIIVTAASEYVPETLFNQLNKNGILIAPVGSKEDQQLCRFTYDGTQYKKEVLEYVRFVPLLSGLE